VCGDRLRDCEAILLRERLTKAGDRHLLKGEGNVECELLLDGPCNMSASLGKEGYLTERQQFER